MPSVAIQCVPNSLLTGSVTTAITGAIDRAFREARIGGTLDGHWISLIPTGTYVWFATTSSLGLWGIDPSTHTNNLGTGYRCVISGSSDAAQVAEQLRYTVSLIPNFSASRIGSVTTVTSSIMTASIVHAGIAWNRRGFADLRGLRQRSSTGNNGNTNAVVAQSLPVPGISGSRLRGMRVGRTVSPGAIRVAVYYAEGGASTTDPNGSTLFYDFGQTQGNVTEGYDYVYISGTAPIIPTTGSLWLTFKGDSGQGNNLYQLQGSSDATNCDFTIANTFISTAGVSPTTAFPTTFSFAGSNPFAIIMDAAICFDSPPFAGAGDVEFRFGSHVSASAYGSQVGITGTVQMRGVFPPIIGAHVVSSSIGVGTTHTTQLRGGVYQDGQTIANPLSATLVVDLGQTSGAATSQFVSLAAPTSSYTVINSGTYIAPIWKNDDGNISILYADSAHESVQNPGYNPSDWMGSSEYDTYSTASGGAINPDETVAFVSLFPTGTNDTRSGNFPSLTMLFRVDGFTFTEGGADPTGSGGDTTLTSSLFSATYIIGNSSLFSTATLVQDNLSATFSIGQSSLFSTATLTQNNLSATFLVGNSSLFSTATLTQSDLSATYSIGNSSLLPGEVTLSQNNLSATFFIETSTLQATATLIQGNLSATFIIGDSTASVGAVTISQNDLSATYTFGNSVLFAENTLTQNDLSSTFLVGNGNLIPSLTMSYNDLSATYLLGTSLLIPGAVTLVQSDLSGVFIFGPTDIMNAQSSTMSASIFSATYTLGTSVLLNENFFSIQDFSSSFFVDNSNITVGGVTLSSTTITPTFIIGNARLPGYDDVDVSINPIRFRFGGSSGVDSDEESTIKKLEEGRMIIDTLLVAGDQKLSNKIDVITERKQIKIKVIIKK